MKGEILANIWQTRLIARIDPATGKVKAWIDLSALPETSGTGNPDAVPNGVAYDAEHDRLFVTGKDWPHLYEVRLIPPERWPVEQRLRGRTDAAAARRAMCRRWGAAGFRP